MEGRFHIVIDLRLRDKVQQAVAWHEFGHIINDADNLIAGETYFDSQIDDDYEMRSKGMNGYGKEKAMTNPPAPVSDDGISVEIIVDGKKYSGKLNKA